MFEEGNCLKNSNMDPLLQSSCDSYVLNYRGEKSWYFNHNLIYLKVFEENFRFLLPRNFSS